MARTRKITFAGPLRGVEVRGVAEYSPGHPGSYWQPPDGPELGAVAWAEGFDPGLSDDDEEGWSAVEALVWAEVEAEEAADDAAEAARIASEKEEE